MYPVAIIVVIFKVTFRVAVPVIVSVVIVVCVVFPLLVVYPLSLYIEVGTSMYMTV